MVLPDADRFEGYDQGGPLQNDRSDNTTLKIAFAAVLSALLTGASLMIVTPRNQATRDDLTQMSQNLEKEVTNIESQQASQQAQISSMQATQNRIEVQLGRVTYKLNIPDN